jgi:hypothetical protein
LIRIAERRRALLCVLALLSGGCGKFQQARECGTFVKTVNAWLASPEAQHAADAGTSSDAKQVAGQARRTAEHYAELSRRLAALHVQSEELAPRVKRYEQIADSAASTLREVADALEQGDLEKARQKRMDFDAVAQREPLLVNEINGVCR